MRGSASIPVVVWLEGPILVQAQILGLLVTQLCEVCVERGEVEAGHILVWGGEGGREREREPVHAMQAVLSSHE